MKTSINGISLIKKYEGSKLKAYRCPANVLTIGYGHTGKDVFEGLIIDQKKADELLIKDLEKFEKQINSLSLSVNQNKFDALISFTYNLGFGSLQKSTLLKKIKENPNDVTIKDEFMKWTRAGGKVLQGLVNRRKSEYELYVK